MPRGWALAKFENCFHTGGGGGGDGLVTLVVVVAVFCADAISLQLMYICELPCNILLLLVD